MQDLVSQHYDQYLHYLRELVKRPSPFEEPEKVQEAILYCKAVLEENLPDYQLYFDAENNLIGLPKEPTVGEEMLYLSAHIDTVGADLEKWDEPFHPWEPYEDENELVARGVNDCKAGVAYQLFISTLMKEGLIELKNLCFTISFKEEGSGKKTGQEIGRQLGQTLPMSEKATTFMVLENNVYVGDRPKLCIYLSERANYVVKLRGSMEELQEALMRLPGWNPVAIAPAQAISDGELHQQKGGHICSLQPEENLLRKMILEAQAGDCIQAGEEMNFAVIPADIYLQTGGGSVVHTLVINNRSFDTLEEVEKQLEGLEYEQVKDFSISQGFNVEEKFSGTSMSDSIEQCVANAPIDIEYTYNVGASDGTIVYGSMKPELKANFYPIVAGPGCRSQRSLDRPRLTHGKNETFDKESGRKTLIFLTELVLSVLNPS